MVVNARRGTFLRLWPLVLLPLGVATRLASAAQDGPKHVLVLYSFGRDYFEGFSQAFRTELARLSADPVELFEVSLETARFADAPEAPFLDYVHALSAERRFDLMVAIAGPAGRFSVQNRDALFPSTPLLLGAVERRMLPNIASVPLTTALPVAIDLPMAVENILRVAPATTEIVMVLGGSAMSRFWLAETQREFQSLSDRVRFSWLHDLSLEEMKERVAALPPHAAILFGEYVDAAGAVEGPDYALTSLREVTSAPIFGLFETQMGKGIVGGPILSDAEAGRQTAATAHRILNGESPETIEERWVTASSLVYDFRELERWGIKESLLPPGSTVLFRRPTLWNEYRLPVTIGLGVVAMQATLIAGLLLQRARRRAAQEEARALSRRLLTAHEDERRRLARELHDDLSQRLARFAIDAGQMEERLSKLPKERAPLSVSEGLVQLSDDVHDLAYQLHPSVLEDLGLNEALAVECEQFSSRESMRAQMTCFEVPSELPLEVAVCLFRIAQEALRNAARHSRAEEVRLAVTAANGGVRMTVSDDGVGFVPAQRRPRSLGHAGMRERAQLVGGTVDVQSSPGRGTTVTVTVPHPVRLGSGPVSETS